MKKLSHYIKTLFLQSHFMIHRDSSENRSLRSSRDYFLLIKLSSSFVVTSIWSHQNRILIFVLIDLSTISKINKYEKIISTWIDHLDWMIVERLDSKSTNWWRNWRYESFQISRCDSKSSRSCMKNWMMMWWDKNQLIRSDDQIIWSKRFLFERKVLRPVLGSLFHQFISSS
jgi:hypothetical protein